MAQNKHKTKRRIICILCASIIALYALAIPIGAVVNSSQVPDGSASLYAQSTFPFTIGFVQNDADSNNNYIFSTHVGGLGQNNQVTTEGDDVFYWVTPDQSNEVSSAIRYYYDSIVYPTEYKFVSGQNEYNRGYGTVRFEYDTITADVDLTTESIVFKAYDLYYNPMFTMDHETEAGSIVQSLPKTSKAWMYMIPSIILPTLTDYNTQAIVGTYSVEVLIADQEGNKQWHTYSQTVDTRLGHRDIQAINYDLLASYANPSNIRYNESGEVAGSNSTILIEEFRAFLDVDYYEFVEPESDIVGTWVMNDVLTLNENISSNNGRVEYKINGFYNTLDANRNLIEFPIASIQSYRYDNISTITIYGLDNGIQSTQYHNGYYFQSSSMSLSGSIRCDTPSSSMRFIGTSDINYNNLQTFTITGGDDIENEALKHLLLANATKQGSTATVAEEGTWEIVDNDIINEITVTYPMYNISTGSPTETTFQKLWLSYPDASKYFDSIIGEVEDYAPIPEDMYQDYSGWLANGVGGFFKAQLFPGISLGGIVGILIMFGCTMAILKIFAGG